MKQHKWGYKCSAPLNEWNIQGKRNNQIDYNNPQAVTRTR